MGNIDPPAGHDRDNLSRRYARARKPASRLITASREAKRGTLVNCALSWKAKRPATPCARMRHQADPEMHEPSEFPLMSRHNRPLITAGGGLVGSANRLPRTGHVRPPPFREHHPGHDDARSNISTAPSLSHLACHLLPKAGTRKANANSTYSECEPAIQPISGPRKRQTS